WPTLTKRRGSKSQVTSARVVRSPRPVSDWCPCRSTAEDMTESRVPPPRRPEVGVGVLVFREGSVLLGLRRGSHGAGTWSPPGGHLEVGEDPLEWVRREAFEEAAITLGGCQFVGITNDIFEAEGRHYLTLFYTAALIGGTPRVREPEKCEAWQWCPRESLP